MPERASPSIQRTFHSASKLGTFRAAERSGTTAETSQLLQKRERIENRAREHFAKHRETWINRKYGEMLAKSGERLGLTPRGISNDRAALLQRAASLVIDQAHARRMHRIKQASRHLIRDVQHKALKR